MRVLQSKPLRQVWKDFNPQMDEFYESLSSIEQSEFAEIVRDSTLSATRSFIEYRADILRGTKFEHVLRVSRDVLNVVIGTDAFLLLEFKVNTKVILVRVLINVSIV